MGARDFNTIELPTLSAVRSEKARRGTLLKTQPGPQTVFDQTKADIGIFGGAAGAGKTFAVLREPTKHIDNPQFSAVFFRRETPQITNPGGMWDESLGMYQKLGATPLSHKLAHRFPSGSYVKFSHLEYEDSVLAWDGSQIPLICFDQLEHFTRKQFFYMLSRNRSTCGVKPYVRATCNPNADSWLADFISWWINQETGFPIPERSGVLRWFIRDGDNLLWANSREELMQKHGNPELPDDHPDQPIPLSVTFIPGTVYDNKELLRINPQYLGNLKALNRVERERLLGGNWKIRASAGLLFRREWCEIVDALPHDCDLSRGWDLAATKKTEGNDPDWTVGVKLAKQRSTGRYFLCGDVRLQDSPGFVKTTVKNTAEADGNHVRVALKQDPGQAGKAQAGEYVTHLDGFNVHTSTTSGDKVTNFGGFSAQVEAGNVAVLRGTISEAFLLSLEGFPDAKHDDDADAVSAAYQDLNDPRGQGIRDYMRDQAAATSKPPAVEEPKPEAAAGASALMGALQ